jgi:hypothetical protein
LVDLLEGEAIRRALEDAERSRDDLPRAFLWIAVAQEHRRSIGRECKAEQLGAALEEVGPGCAAVGGVEERVVRSEGAVHFHPCVGAHEDLLGGERIDGRDVGRAAGVGVRNRARAPGRTPVMREEELPRALYETGRVQMLGVVGVHVERVDDVGGERRADRAPGDPAVERLRERVGDGAPLIVPEEREDGRRLRSRDRVVHHVRGVGREHRGPLASAVLREIQARLHADEEALVGHEVEERIAEVRVL